MFSEKIISLSCNPPILLASLASSSDKNTEGAFFLSEFMILEPLSSSEVNELREDIASDNKVDMFSVPSLLKFLMMGLPLFIPIPIPCIGRVTSFFLTVS